jgi:hypothetical protein
MHKRHWSGVRHLSDNENGERQHKHSRKYNENATRHSYLEIGEAVIRQRGPKSQCDLGADIVGIQARIVRLVFGRLVTVSAMMIMHAFTVRNQNPRYEYTQCTTLHQNTRTLRTHNMKTGHIHRQVFQ